MEEKLREAACFGDSDALHQLVEAGVDVNGQHKVSRYTYYRSMMGAGENLRSSKYSTYILGLACWA